MADDKEKEDKENADGASEGGEGAEGGKKSKKKLLLILGPVVLILAGVMGFLVFGMGGGDKPAEEAEIAAGEQGKKAPDKFAFYDLPDILVNLASQGGSRNFLKISVSLQLENELDLPKMEKLQPRIIDKFQVYLRGLSLDDLQGTEGVYRLREELLRRVNAAVEPIKVEQVLFKEILVQ